MTQSLKSCGPEKVSHWISDSFPQIADTQRYRTSSPLDLRRPRLPQHPVLGPRLEHVRSVLNVDRRSAEEIFSYPDHLKFRSCMTLFLTAATDNALFKDALLKYFDGTPDQLTLDILAQQRS